MVVETRVVAVEMARVDGCGNPRDLVIGQTMAVLESKDSRMVSVPELWIKNPRQWR